MEIILSNELLLMQRLNYYLTIHNPYRPVEGFLIDIKTRCSLVNPDRLRAGIDEFLENTFFTEACLLFAPSQIALAAVLHAASKEQENLDNYVIESLFHNTRDKLKVLISAVQKIRLMVKNVAIPEKDEFRRIEKKLDRCRNQDNNPASEALVFAYGVPRERIGRTEELAERPKKGTVRVLLSVHLLRSLQYSRFSVIFFVCDQNMSKLFTYRIF